MSELRTLGGKVTMNVTEYVNGVEKAKKVTVNFRSESKANQTQLETISKKYRELGAEVSFVTDDKATLVKQIKAEVTASKNADRQVAAITKSYKLLNAQLGRSTDRQEKSAALSKLGANATLTQRKEVIKLISSYQKLRAEQSELNNVSGKTQTSMRNLRGISQNLGWQLQDVAVQAQMGTDGLIIFAQQGSQMAAAFGAGGALIGAGIALVGMFAGIAKASHEAANATEELEVAGFDLVKVLREQAAELRYLEEAQIRYLKAADAKQLEGYEKKLEQVNARLETLNKTTKSHQLDDTADEYEKLQAEVITLEDIIYDLKDTMENYGKVTEDTTDKHEDLYKSLTDEVAVFGKSAREVELYNAKQDDASQIIIDLINQKHDLIDSEKEYSEALKSANKANDERKAHGEQLLKAEEAQQKSINKQIEALQLQAFTYGQTAQEIALYRIIQSGASVEQIKEAKAAIAVIDEQIAAEKAKAAVLVSIDAEAEQRKSRKSKIDSVTKQADGVGKSQAAIELEQHQANTDLLKASILELDNWEYQQAAQINQALETEQQRHTQAMIRIKGEEEIADKRLQQTLVNNATAGLVNLGEVAEEGSALAKLAFLGTQAQAAANVMVQSEQAKWALNATAMSPVQLAANEALIQANRAVSLGVIAGTTFAGLFDGGGNIGSDQHGIVAENRPEIVNGALVVGAASVTSASDTAKMLEGKGETTVNISQNVTIPPSSQESATQIANQVLAGLMNDIRGNGSMMKMIRAKI